jgi:hypothetical protein
VRVSVPDVGPNPCIVVGHLVDRSATTTTTAAHVDTAKTSTGVVSAVAVDRRSVATDDDGDCQDQRESPVNHDRRPRRPVHVVHHFHGRLCKTEWASGQAGVLPGVRVEADSVYAATIGVAAAITAKRRR